jgi:hypothetical protein
VPRGHLDLLSGRAGLVSIQYRDNKAYNTMACTTIQGRRILDKNQEQTFLMTTFIIKVGV